MSDFKIWLVFLFVISNVGCATYQRQINLTPQKNETWRKSSPRYLQSSCNDAKERCQAQNGDR